VFHQYGCFLFAALGPALVVTAPGGRERLVGTVFACCVVLSFGVSALYHRVTWRPRARRWMRRLDHAGAFLLIGGTYTPFALLALGGAWQISILAVVWAGVAVAILVTLAWPSAPTWLAAGLGIALGWVSVIALPKALDEIGAWGVVLLGVGGLLYTAGAIVYARRWPDPAPAVFGYHELFHVLTILAAGCQYATVAFFLLPTR
jgi:hemolysin III